MKKKNVQIAAIMLVFLMLVGCSGQYKDGTYEGKGDGNESEVVVSVNVSKGKIDKIDIVNHGETESMMVGVKDNTIPDIIKKQTTDGIDALAGATKSSQAVLDAVKQVIEQAKK
ncbi:FMN-binding protein [Paenibacillus sp. N1-5-1-14]|uniref:FMN-binding protein n=1 Tax=Paenibacillus radicibacter TaxID=2972488 RepID=UPI002158F9EA|nr:FMN-binding protein [Paenibacillus radicibacter]MCR8642323.1 FMN-binding protein [Paenibacillus radicibacter]